MIPLSTRSKEAIKTALAMVITYGIALAMDWDKPFWAGFSVIFCSLATAGESIDRGIQRVVGTLIAGVVTLALLALFPQDRWLFLLSMSAFIALCTYRLSSGSRFFFIWFAAGFTVPILAILGGGLAPSTFDTVILRAEQTVLGVVVYSLVAILLWPRRGGAGFESAVRTLCDAQHQLFGRYLSSMAGAPDDGGAERLRNQITGQLAGLGGKLEGAVYDSDEMRQARHAWRRCIRELSSLNETLDRWRLGFEELEDLDLHRLMPGLNEFGSELETRFAAIDTMIAGQRTEQQPRSLNLRADPDSLSALSHFQRAAALLCRDQLAHIDNLTLRLFETISDIRGYGRAKVPARTSAPMLPPRAIDLDRLAATVRQSAALWLTLLSAIYVPAFPNTVGVVALANAFAMFLSTVPHVQSGVLFLPVLFGSASGGLLYIFLMPHLSGFVELAAMIFAVTFLISYVFHRPQDTVIKLVGLTLVIILIGVDNQQSYNFLYFANWFMAGVLFVLALMVAWRFPISFRPEDRFLAMLGRFFRSADFLVSTSRRDASRKTSWLAQGRRAFHLHEVTVLPQRLRAWGGALPSAALGNTSRDLVQSLLISLQALSYRLQALLEAEPAAQSGSLVRELLEDVRDWRVGVQQAFGRLATDPSTVDQAAFRARVDARLARLEACVEEALDTADEASVSIGERRNLYRLLGAYRGVSEALIEFARQAGAVDWGTLREERF